MLRATTACTFSTSQLPKLLRTPRFLTQFTSKCASRHNAVHFFNISISKSSPILRCFVPFHFEIGFAPLFISHLPRCLRTRRFSEPTFQPSGATKPRKNTEFRDFPTFSRTCIFFLLIFSLLTLLPADCFFISPYCFRFLLMLSAFLGHSFCKWSRCNDAKQELFAARALAEHIYNLLCKSHTRPNWMTCNDLSPRVERLLFTAVQLKQSYARRSRERLMLLHASSKP